MVANQLARLGDFAWEGAAEPVGDRRGPAAGAPGCDSTWAPTDAPGFHRYHSAELVTDLRCGQLPDGMLDGLDGPRWQPGDQVHVVLDDDGAPARAQRQRPSSGAAHRVVEGDYDTVQRVGERVWRLPVTAFWQAHRDAAARRTAPWCTEWAAGSRCDDGLGSLRRRRGVRRGAGRRGR